MESGILRLILLVVGAGVILGIYLAGRSRLGRNRPDRDDDAEFFETPSIRAHETSGGFNEIPRGISAQEPEIPELSDIVLGLRPADEDLAAEFRGPRVDREEPVAAASSYVQEAESDVDPDIEPDVEPESNYPPETPPAPAASRPPASPAREPRTPEFLKAGREKRKAAAAPPAPPAAGAPVKPDRLIVLHIHARRDAPYRGAELLSALLDEQLQFGEMDIFHLTDGKSGQPIFSVANLVNPGTFPINGMEQFVAPGVSLILPLPAPVSSVTAFERMLACGRAIVDRLGGDLRDERHNRLTLQAIDFFRSDLQEYDRKARLQKHP